MTDKNEHPLGGPIFMLGLLLALGIAMAGYFSGSAPKDANTIKVEGWAKREVKADVAVWHISFSADGKDMGEVYESAHAYQRKVVAFLIESGFEKGAITRGELTVKKRKPRNAKADESKHSTYTISGTVTLRTADVDKVADAQQKVSRLIAQGVLLKSSAPNFLFTDVDKVRTELMVEATKNARLAAEKLVAEVGGKLGKVKGVAYGKPGVTARELSNKDKDHRNVIDKKIHLQASVTFYVE